MTTSPTTISFTRSKRGLPVVYETGGGRTNTGNATLWCGPRGERLTPLWVPLRPYSNGEAAGFVLRPGMHQVHAWWSRHGEGATIHRVVSLDHAANTAVIEPVWGATPPDPIGEIPDGFQGVVEAALAKARSYHARYTAWAAPMPPRPNTAGGAA